MQSQLPVAALKIRLSLELLQDRQAVATEVLEQERQTGSQAAHPLTVDLEYASQTQEPFTKLRCKLGKQ